MVGMLAESGAPVVQGNEGYFYAAYLLIWAVSLAYLARLHALARDIDRRRREQETGGPPPA